MYSDYAHWAVPASDYIVDSDLADDPYDDEMSSHDMA